MKSQPVLWCIKITGNHSSALNEEIQSAVTMFNLFTELCQHLSIKDPSNTKGLSYIKTRDCWGKTKYHSRRVRGFVCGI